MFKGELLILPTVTLLLALATSPEAKGFCRTGAQNGAPPPGALAAITEHVRLGWDHPAALRRALNRLAGPGTEAQTSYGDVDGDRRPDLLITFGWCKTPVILYRGAARRQPVLAPARYPFPWVGGGGAKVDRIADVNRDGRPEVVAEYFALGGSATHRDLYIYAWDGQILNTLFYDHLTDWVGPTEWQVGDRFVTTQCYVMGPFMHKMTEHRLRTDRFVWDPARGQYVHSAVHLTPVTTQLQQVSGAERLFQDERYEEAAVLYRKACLPAAEAHR